MKNFLLAACLLFAIPALADTVTDPITFTNNLGTPISGSEFVQINQDKALDFAAKFNRTITINISFTGIVPGDSYDIWGSDKQNTLGTLLDANQTADVFTLPKNFDFISVTAASGKITVDDVEVIVSPPAPTPTPEGSTLLLFGTGAGFFLTMKKFRKKIHV